MDTGSARGPRSDHGPSEQGYLRMASSEFPSIEGMLDALMGLAGPDDVGEMHVADADVRNPCIAMRIANVEGDFSVIVHPDADGCIDGVLTLLDCGVGAECLFISDNGQVTRLLDYLDY